MAKLGHHTSCPLGDPVRPLKAGKDLGLERLDSGSSLSGFRGVLGTHTTGCPTFIGRGEGTWCWVSLEGKGVGSRNTQASWPRALDILCTPPCQEGDKSWAWSWVQMVNQSPPPLPLEVLPPGPSALDTQS